MDAIIDNLSTGYRQGGGVVRTVSGNIRARLRAGRLTCLVGANGSGKSTLLRTLSGAQRPVGGDILIEEDGRTHQVPKGPARARVFSSVFTIRRSLWGLPVGELIAMGRIPHTGFFGGLAGEDRKAVERAVETMGIARLAGRKAHQLSDGELQKCLVARALAQDTPIMLLDEPTAFLDYGSKVEHMAAMARLARGGKAVLMSTHDIGLALKCADELWVLHQDGRMETGTPWEMARSGAVEKAVGGNGWAVDPETMEIEIKQR